ncbi:MAG: CoA transferase [Chloroflexi bacterium]|nr:CoA transferase [Chloroflexota bacterium]
MAKKLFEGIRVVDFTLYLTGPLTTQALSNCGAEVIKIDTRSQMTGGGAGGQPMQTNKLSATLNFASPRGLELARRLIATADIVVENFAGGSLKRRGLGYDDIKTFKPDIIYLSTCMQGQTGPYSSHAASGHKLTALTGFDYISGWPDRPPSYMAAYTDIIAPRYNIIALLAALEYRRRTGKGQFLDMSQYEGGIQFMAPAILDYSVNKQITERAGNKYPYAAPHNAYRCTGEEMWCAIAVFTDKEWLSFCKVIGKPALAKDSRFTTLLARKENEEELDRLVNEWTSSRSAEDVMNQMQAAGVPAGMVENGDDHIERNHQLKHRHFLWELDHPGGPFFSPAGVHFQLSKTPYELQRSPIFGEHNNYVYKDILGLSDEDIAQLTQDGVIG